MSDFSGPGVVPDGDVSIANGAVGNITWPKLMRLFFIQNNAGGVIRVLYDGDAATPCSATRYSVLLADGNTHGINVKLSGMSILNNSGATLVINYASGKNGVVLGWS